MADIPAHEHARDTRAIIFFLATVLIGAIVLASIWHMQRPAMDPERDAANQPAGVGLVQGNTGGGAGF